jgi:hypothetical protein
MFPPNPLPRACVLNAPRGLDFMPIYAGQIFAEYRL